MTLDELNEKEDEIDEEEERLFEEYRYVQIQKKKYLLIRKLYKGSYEGLLVKPNGCHQFP